MMICPNCNNEMDDKSEQFWSIGDWDSDYPTGYSEKYYCKKCKIKYEDESWEIPKLFERATEKQVKTVKFINYHLGTMFVPLLKKQCCEIIGKHLSEAIKSKENDALQRAEWFREEYGEFDYY